MFISSTQQKKTKQKQKQTETQNYQIELISSLLNRTPLAMVAGVIIK